MSLDKTLNELIKLRDSMTAKLMSDLDKNEHPILKNIFKKGAQIANDISNSPNGSIDEAMRKAVEGSNVITAALRKVAEKEAQKNK